MATVKIEGEVSRVNQSGNGFGDEIWRSVVGYEGTYEVSNRGRVRRVATRTGRPEERLLKAALFSSGYPGVTLSRDGVRASKSVHRLVAAAFLGPAPEGSQVRHLNGDPTDNRLSNLRYGTALENAADKTAHGTYRNKYTDRTECTNGHPYVDGSFRIRLRGHIQERVCRECARDRINKAQTEAAPSREQVMAKVSIEGVVSRLNTVGSGFGLKESREHNGKTYTTYWSVFPPRNEDRTVNVGDRVEVDGFLRTEVSKRDGRYVDHTVNNARVNVTGGAPQSAPQADQWAGGGSYGDDNGFGSETPF